MLDQGAQLGGRRCRTGGEDVQDLRPGSLHLGDRGVHQPPHPHVPHPAQRDRALTDDGAGHTVEGHRAGDAERARDPGGGSGHHAEAPAVDLEVDRVTAPVDDGNLAERAAEETGHAWAR